ncbi:MAG: MOSC domain-containing protein [Myxococcota bacterium]
MKLLSVNTGFASNIVVRGKSVRSGIRKSPRSDAVALGPNGLEGDVIVSASEQERPRQAVCLFSSRHYGHWSKFLDRELEHGAFGENLTVDGALERGMRPGDVYQIGTAVVEITAPRMPCRKLSAALGRSMSRQLLEAVHLGAYARVLQPGAVQANDELVLTDRREGARTLHDVIWFAFFECWDTEALKETVAETPLYGDWEARIARRLEQAKGVTPWFGQRLFKLSEVDKQRIHVEDGFDRQVPPLEPGTQVTVRYGLASDSQSYSTFFADVVQSKRNGFMVSLDRPERARELSQGQHLWVRAK